MQKLKNAKRKTQKTGSLSFKQFQALSFRDPVWRMLAAQSMGPAPRARQSRVVRMTGPSSVMAMVCSLCAPREPSEERSVQPSLGS